MNKKILITTLLSTTLLLSACGQTNQATNNNNSTNDVVEDVKQDNKQLGNKDLIGTTLKGATGNYKINGIEYVPDAYNPDKLNIVFLCDYTNTSDENQTPWLSFATEFKGEQETDKAVEQLNGAVLADDYHAEEFDTAFNKEIKPGATVPVVMGFELLYNDKPVFLRDFDGGSTEYVLVQE